MAMAMAQCNKNGSLPVKAIDKPPGSFFTFYMDLNREDSMPDLMYCLDLVYCKVTGFSTLYKYI